MHQSFAQNRSQVRYGWRVQPADPPDLETLPRGPASDQIARWVTTWKPAHFHVRGRWRVGIVRDWVHLADGRWLAHLDHAGDGMHDGWQQSTWAFYAPGGIVPVDPVPPAR